MTGRGAVGRYLDAGRRSIWGQRSAGRAADPAGLRAHRGPAGPPRGGRRRVRPGSALRRGRGPDLADDRRPGWRVRYDPAAEVLHAEPGRLAARCWPAGSGTARSARAAGPPASGPGAAAGPAGLAGRRGGRACWPGGPSSRWPPTPPGPASWPGCCAAGASPPGTCRGRWPRPCCTPGSALAGGAPSTRSRRSPRASPGPVGGAATARAAAARPAAGSRWPRCWPGRRRPPGCAAGRASTRSGSPSAYLADEAAYGAGVYRGALAERLADPLLPRLAWRPRPRHPGRRVLP